ncbi:MAG: ATPase, T2SS/T4P/T4SS family [Pygmaiobacter sp.]
MRDSYYAVVARFPPPFSIILGSVQPEVAGRITEVRIRSNRAIQLILENQIVVLSPNGTLCPIHDLAVTTTAAQVEECFLALCDYSIHTHQRELQNGFFTLSGGHRVGVAGTAVCSEVGAIIQLKDVTSLNVRIARTALTTLDSDLAVLLQRCEDGIIVAGEPKSGKTTVLRMISRRLSDCGLQLSVIDQRCELWPCGAQGKAEPIPDCCDVLSGYPRAEGILQALRCLSPDVILCDEIGSIEDVAAIEAGVNAGVRMIVSIHARNLAELQRRPQAKRLLQTGAFGKIVFLVGRSSPGKVAFIHDCTSCS